MNIYYVSDNESLSRLIFSFEEKIINDKKQFSLSFFKNEEVQKRKFEKYFENYGFGINMVSYTINDTLHISIVTNH
jgi:hypothetical protein